MDFYCKPQILIYSRVIVNLPFANLSICLVYRSINRELYSGGFLKIIVLIGLPWPNSNPDSLKHSHSITLEYYFRVDAE